jgi:hypothetical protein
MWNMHGDVEDGLDDALVLRAVALARRSARPGALVDELLRAKKAHAESKTIAVVRDLDEWTISLLAAVLTDEFRRRAPRLGELIAVSYDGRARPQTAGRLCARYGLRVDRGASRNVDARRFGRGR